MKIVFISVIALFLIGGFVLFANPFFLPDPKIDCGNGVTQSWGRGVADGPLYYHDENGDLLATCSSWGVQNSQECIELSRLCNEYQEASQ